jgi:hypothetical protein
MSFNDPDMATQMVTGGGMTGDRIEALTSLLLRAEEAHGVYETTELNGVYDENWPAWYAEYAVGHGIGDLLGHPVTAEELGSFLGRTFADFQASDPGPDEPWAVHTARRLAAEL